MTDLPVDLGLDAPPAFTADMTLPEFRAEMRRVYGGPGGLTAHVLDTQRAQGDLLGRHDAELEVVREHAQGVNAFGEYQLAHNAGVDAFGQQQLALNATMTQAVTRGARRQDHIERHLGSTQVVELVAAIALAVASVLFALWVGSHDVIGGVVVSHTMAVWVALALGIGWTVIVAVMLAGWFRPHQETEAAPAAATPAAQAGAAAPPTAEMPAIDPHPRGGPPAPAA